MAAFRFLIAALVAWLGTGQAGGAPGPGQVVRITSFASRFVQPRQVDIWLPADYATGHGKYDVLYMHDGQNLFDPALAYGGVAWDVDDTLAWLQQLGQARRCIVVGIWNTPLRFPEYTPAAPFRAIPPARQAQLRPGSASPPLSDEYLRFIVDELKPYVDQHYRTRTGRRHTYIMGSSMGGLISLYAALEYPRVFGGAGCLSTHWPLSLTDNPADFTNTMLAYLALRLPRARRPRLYFDYGTTTLDARYAVHQVRVDSLLRAQGYPSRRWQTRRFEGAAHNEAAWKARLAVPLRFLLGK